MLLRTAVGRIVQRRGLTTPPPKAPKEESVAGEVWDTVWSLSKFAALAHVFHEYCVEISMCSGPSMLPTLNQAGDIVLMERVSPRLRNIRTGDIVICKSPTNPTQTVCKRIAAVEGEPIPSHFSLVPPGHVWLLGDNAGNSTDSRYYGAVPAALIKGKVLLRIFPFSQIRQL